MEFILNDSNFFIEDDKFIGGYVDISEDNNFFRTLKLRGASKELLKRAIKFNSFIIYMTDTYQFIFGLEEFASIETKSNNHLIGIYIVDEDLKTLREIEEKDFINCISEILSEKEE